jgi:hypothetical protein
MAGRPAGGPKYGGRKKGTPNKATQSIQQRLDDLGCDPIEGMVKIANEALSSADFQLAGNMYKELAQYVAPKRKSIEHTGPDGDALQLVTRVELVPLDNSPD